MLLYFGGSESLWGASPGKAVCGLTVAQASGRPVRASQALARAAVYLLVLYLPDLVSVAIWNSTVPELLSLKFTDPFMPMLVVLFATARRRNGYAAVHDLVTRTRVVERRRTGDRPVPVADCRPPEGTVMARVESFDVLDVGVPAMPHGWHQGFDARLRRPVWVRLVPPGTPPLSPARRALMRPTRLRWLAGRRLDREAWDAFEAAAGVPLNAAVATRARIWREVRAWLLDLARECAVRGEPVRRDLDRLWVVDGGGAKLVDDPAMDAAGVAADTQPGRDARFLLDVARTALTPRGAPEQPMPLHARAFLEQLDSATPPEMASIVRALEELHDRRAEVTRGWRALPIVVVTALLVISALLPATGISLVLDRRASVPLDFRIAAGGLQHLLRADRHPPTLPLHEREALEVALVSRYRVALADARLFDEYDHLLALRAEHRALAAQLLGRYPPGPGPALESSSPVLSTLEFRAARERPVSLLAGFRFFLGFLILGSTAAAMVGMAAAVTVRGAFLRLAGLELVRRNGRRASRFRILARTVFTWSPVLISFLSLIRIGMVQARPTVHVDARSLFNPLDRLARTDALWMVAILLLIAGAVAAIVRPERGIQDRLAGTWIVPR
jgi:hypothetical protein